MHHDYYVDDGLCSKRTAAEALDLVCNTTALAKANLLLHKIVSNSVDVMEAFPTQDRTKDIKELDLRKDSLQAQGSLGVCWVIERDTFTFCVTPPDKPFTQRGVLLIINSIYDPLGLAVRVLLEGRLPKRLAAMGKKGNAGNLLRWDEPLPDALQQQRKRWQDC